MVLSQKSARFTLPLLLFACTTSSYAHNHRPERFDVASVERDGFQRTQLETFSCRDDPFAEDVIAHKTLLLARIAGRAVWHR